jgi:hypothetical protein
MNIVGVYRRIIALASLQDTELVEVEGLHSSFGSLLSRPWLANFFAGLCGKKNILPLTLVRY